jgi:hypothetical protein
LKPHSISHVGVCLTPEAGANDALIGVRVVPAGRQGKTVFGRTLNDREPDSGEPIRFYPYAGESIHFASGSVQIRLLDIDRASKPAPDGYAKVSNTIWTWLTFGEPPDPNLFRYLFAACRRLDAAHTLCLDVLSALTDRPEPFILARNRMFGALASAELMSVALARGIDMLQALPGQFSIQTVVPEAATRIASALHEIRNAFEHIEDRAIGNVRGRPHPDALSIFDQRRLVSSGILTYASHALDLHHDVLPALVELRRFVVDVAVAMSGAARTLNVPLDFPAAPPGSFERITERAYYLWENRSGSQWWDADANWFEAERTDAALARNAG